MRYSPVVLETFFVHSWTSFFSLKAHNYKGSFQQKRNYIKFTIFMVYNYTTKIALHFSLKNVSSIWPYNSFFSFVLFSSVVLVIIVYGPRFLEVKVGRFSIASCKQILYKSLLCNLNYELKERWYTRLAESSSMGQPY